MTDLHQIPTTLVRPNIDLWEGDFDTIAAFLPTIDLIYTDPPYPREQAIQCFERLAFWAPKLLNDGGSLITLVPHYLLEEVMEIFGDRDERLKFRWIYCQNQEQGPHPRMAMGIEVMWKPMLHYVKRAFPQGRGFVKDMIHIPEPQKNMHQWQQSEQWADYYIPRMTNEGDTVLDPYMGTGTTAIVTARNNRRYIGIDIETAKLAQDRIWRELSITTIVRTVFNVSPGRMGQRERGENTNGAT